MQPDSSDHDPTLSPGSPALPIPPTPTRLQLPPDAFKAAPPSGVPRFLQSATFSQDTCIPQRREVLCRLLQGWLDQLAPTGELPAGVVGDLQSLTTSHAMLLLSHMGFTKVYHLKQEDFLNVDILNRSPAMSCDRL